MNIGTLAGGHVLGLNPGIKAVVNRVVTWGQLGRGLVHGKCTMAAV
jgi:uncharacterized membrane protein YesL